MLGGIEAGPKSAFEFANSPIPHPSQVGIEFGRDGLWDAVRYAKSIEGVTGMVLGVQDAQELRDDILWVANEAPFSADELAAVRRLGKQYAPSWGSRFG